MAHRNRETRSFTARLDVAVLERLRERSGRAGESNARLAERLLDEGLRMEEFPGIVFRSGPAGRRAALAKGPDVWEVVRDLRRAREAGVGDPGAVVCEASHLERGAVELAAAYYDAYPDEVDERIRSNDEMAERVRRTLEGTPLSG
jgi:hypothetical protein